MITYHRKTCWIESYHSVSKTAEIYNMEMKEKQLWTFTCPTVWLIFNTWPAGPIWTQPLNQQGSPKKKSPTFKLELLLPLKDDCNICDRAKLFPSRLNTFHNTGYFFFLFILIKTRFSTDFRFVILSQFRLSMLVWRAEFKDCDHPVLTTHTAQTELHR